MQDWLVAIEDLREYLYIDENDLLREKCSNMDYLNELIAEGERLLWKYQDADRMKVSGLLGNLYRLKGDFEVALPYLERYQDYCRDIESDETFTLALLRYAEGLKYARQYEDALGYFKQVIERCESLNIEQYENLAWQHIGKCYVEMGDMKQAESCFLKAMLLRKKMNDPKLLVASERALNFIMKIKM